MRLEQLRHRGRVLRARRREAVGLVRLLGDASRGRVEEIWVGDSHSITFTTPMPPLPGIFRVAEGRWVCHLGPRIMHSIAREGLPRQLHRNARLIRRASRGREVTWFFSFGEIDIRCHLGPRVAASGAAGADGRFVADYVERVRALLVDAGAARGTVVVPVPPSKDTFDHVAFPVAGTVEDRLAAHAFVRSALQEATREPGTPAVQLADLTDHLAEPSGLLDPQLTDDGCHTNAAGRARVREALDAAR